MPTAEKNPLAPEVAARARKALEALRALAKRPARDVQLRPAEGTRGPAVSVPEEAFSQFLEILRQMADGNAVQVVPLHEELTTQGVADLLHVSRPYVIRLLDEGRIPSRKVGTHRRIRAADAVEYKLREDARRKAILDELTAEAQKHGLGY